MGSSQVGSSVRQSGSLLAGALKNVPHLLQLNVTACSMFAKLTQGLGL